eukprot:Lithocolla_globosa_v1_NODE_191_length_5320_cov_8.118139.p8 type:complete len:100 gc:universal NODE_191_length_5320_cov_8.118139:425-724(+)
MENILNLNPLQPRRSSRLRKRPARFNKENEPPRERNERDNQKTTRGNEGSRREAPGQPPTLRKTKRLDAVGQSRNQQLTEAPQVLPRRGGAFLCRQRVP